MSEFKVNPMHYVSSLKSPIGVYLRRTINRKEAQSDKALRDELHDKIVAGQSSDGSWDHLFTRTGNSLWNLALLGFDTRDRSIRKGLEWVRSIQRHEYGGHPGFFNSGKRESGLMRSTRYGEFVPGCLNFYQTTYAVHLFHLFDFDDDKRVQTAVRSYLELWGDKEWLCGANCGSNVLRILIEHPLSRGSKQVERGIRFLSKCQTKTGAWKFRHQFLPFYHIFHVLSQSHLQSAKLQLQNAFPSIVRRQNRNGSWGGKTRETDTFLVIDALRNAEHDPIKWLINPVDETMI